jgi:hypothetical protein
MCDV